MTGFRVDLLNFSIHTMHSVVAVEAMVFRKECEKYERKDERKEWCIRNPMVPLITGASLSIFCANFCTVSVSLPKA